VSFLLNPYVYSAAPLVLEDLVPSVVGSSITNANTSVNYDDIGSWQAGDLAVVITHQFDTDYTPTGYTQVIAVATGDTYGYYKSVSYRVLQAGDTSVVPSDDTVGFDQTVLILRNCSSVLATHDWDYVVSGNTANLSVAEDGVAIAVASDRGAGSGTYPSIGGAANHEDTGDATYFDQRLKVFLGYNSGTNITFGDIDNTYGSNFLLFVAEISQA
jgi:hypothetical protein